MIQIWQSSSSALNEYPTSAWILPRTSASNKVRKSTLFRLLFYISQMCSSLDFLLLHSLFFAEFLVRLDTPAYAKKNARGGWLSGSPV